MRKISAQNIWTAAVFILTPLTAFYLMQFVLGGWFWEYSPRIVLVNYICIGALYFLLCALTNHVVVCAVIVNAAGVIWGCANAFISVFRGTPVLPWDFTALGTALAVADNYKFVPTWQMIAAILIVIALAVLYKKKCLKGKLRPDKQNMKFRGGCLIMFAAILFGMHDFSILEAMKVKPDVWDQTGSYVKEGAVASFLMNIKYMAVEQPKDYSDENVSNIMASISERETSKVTSADAESPNVIAIMNESWADFESFGNLELSESVMDYIQSLDAVRGSAYASVFGAGTSTSEFEFLTGNSMAFLPSGSIPYQQYILGPFPSMASRLKDEGYRCVAIHPGERTSWQRNQAYPRLGFDEFKCAEDMNVELTEEHGYISDVSSFNQIIYEFEHKAEDEKLFVFNVTIQNHGSYTVADYPAEVFLKDEPGKYPMAEQYLTLANKTDEAFKLLVDYFEKQDEPTIIVMFGDHQPSVEQEFLDKAYGVTQDEMTMEQYMGKFKVPFVIWANYDLPEDEIERTSLNFLGQTTLQYAGIEQTAYGEFLNTVSEQVPVLTFAGYFDKAGNAYSHLEETQFDEIIHQYNLLQYENLFGGKTRNNGFFNEKAGEYKQ